MPQSQPLNNAKSNLSSCVFSSDAVSDEQDNEVSSEESDSGNEQLVEPPTGHHEGIMEFSSAPCMCVCVRMCLYAYLWIYIHTYVRICMCICIRTCVGVYCYLSYDVINTALCVIFIPVCFVRRSPLWSALITHQAW